MSDDLPGLVRHVSRLFLVGNLVTAGTALVCWAMDRDDGTSRFAGAVAILLAISAVQLVFWFGLTYWADLADEEPAPDLGADDYR